MSQHHQNIGNPFHYVDSGVVAAVTNIPSPPPTQQTMQTIAPLPPEPTYSAGSGTPQTKIAKRKTKFKFATSNGATAVVPTVTQT